MFPMRADKKAGPVNDRPCFLVIRRLDSLDVYCLGTLGALLDVEGNLLVLFEGAVARGVDRRVVSENVLAAIFRRDEAEALFGVEPFHGTCSHFFSPY